MEIYHCRQMLLKFGLVYSKQMSDGCKVGVCDLDTFNHSCDSYRNGR